MCVVCERVDGELATANLAASHGAIAQLVERFHGMEEVRDSISRSSTELVGNGAALAGLVAGEGCFTVGILSPRVDGTPRRRFRFVVTMADRDLPVLEALRAFIGVGSVSRRPAQRSNWQPTATYTVAGRKGLREALIPFCDRYLLASHKRTQYLRWRD